MGWASLGYRVRETLSRKEKKKEKTTGALARGSTKI